jgi:hypothetical protein
MISSIIILFIESNLVGLFSVTLSYFIYSFFFSLKNDFIFFFIVGFLKHYLGYILGLQTWYCEVRNKRTKTKTKNTLLVKSVAKSPSLLENIQEGIVFVAISFLIRKFLKIKDIYFIAFLTGFILHLLAEFSGIHTIFCKNLYK